MKKWYNIIDSHAKVAEISLFDEIGGYGITSAQFLEDFKAIKDSEHINVYINSIGGSVFDGIAIYNLLSSIKDKVTVEVFGLAASIASVIALAGSELIMDDNSFFVIHNPWTAIVGDAEELRKNADTLDKIKEQVLSIYETHSNLPRETIDKMLNEETWITADEAVKYGFATSVNKQAKAVALIKNITGFSKVPKNLVREPITIKNLSIREVESTLRDVGFSNSEATYIASKLGTEKVSERESHSSNDIELLAEIRSLFMTN